MSRDEQKIIKSDDNNGGTNNAVMCDVNNVLTTYIFIDTYCLLLLII